MTKSKVDRPSGLKYLGFGFYFDSRAHQFKAKPHAESVAKFKARMKQLTCRSWGVGNDYKVTSPTFSFRILRMLVRDRGF